MLRNNLIASEKDVTSFLEKFPDLENDEVIFLALFQRNKHLSLEEREALGLPRCNVIARAICHDKDSVVKALKRWESNPEGFLSKKGLPIPNQCLVPYITVQPVSVQKGYLDFNRIFSEYLVEASKPGNRENTFARIRKADRLFLNCMQHAYSRKFFIDIDFDVPDKAWSGLGYFEQLLTERSVRFLKVETQGGFHYLLETRTIKYNYTQTLAKLEDLATQSFGNPETLDSQKKVWEIAVSNNQAIPVPGCYQYGSFPVKLWD